MKFPNGKKYDIEEIIGTGTFGRVNLVSCDNMQYAMKKMETKGTTCELEILNKLQSDYIVSLVDWSLLGDFLYLVMELCDFNLDELIKRKKKYFDSIQYLKVLAPMSNTFNNVEYLICCYIFEEIVKGVNYLHEFQPPIIHRDIKPENILIKVNSTGNFIKLADFGFAKYFVGSTNTSGVGTLNFRAPEVNDGRYTEKSDIFSLGIVCLELFEINK